MTYLIILGLLAVIFVLMGLDLYRMDKEEDEER